MHHMLIGKTLLLGGLPVSCWNKPVIVLRKQEWRVSARGCPELN